MIATQAIGTKWKKWDLHVHTPCSLRQGYGGDTPEVWEKFISEIEALPDSFSVLGINDYWFLEGYKRLREEHANGRMQNIQALFPVIEMRLNQFGGSKSKLSKANLHVIFDPDLSPETIESQFLNALTSKFQLDSDGRSEWSGSITSESLTDLGRKIKNSIPEDRLDEYESDLFEGFNSLTVSLTSVQELLDRSYFKNRALLALGKTEWDDIKWVDGAIADKKTLINEANIIFTSFEDSSDWSASRDKLVDNRVTSALLDCSDAHTWSSSTNKDRLGNCDTWLKSTPTFAGLVHAISEFEDRVFVGHEPADLRRRRASPERIIESLTVRPNGSKNSELFNYTVPLNQGLVAIIGNKGQGKSALLDCIARGGNSARSAHFAFLNKSRFLNPKNKLASAFEVELRFADNASHISPLNSTHDTSTLERVEYLPQRLIETICASDPLSSAHGAFERELSRVLFHHINDEDRAGQATLEDLLTLRTKAVDATISRLRLECESQSELLVALDNELNEVGIEDLTSRRSEIQSQVDLAERDALAATDRLRTLEEENSESEGTRIHRKELAQVSNELEKVNQQIVSLRAKQADISRELTELQATKDNANYLQTQAIKLNEELRRNLKIPSGDAVSLTVNTAFINELYSERTDCRLKLSAELEKLTESSIGLSQQSDSLRRTLENEDTHRETARQELEELKSRVEKLRGDPSNIDSLRGVAHKIERLNQVPNDIEKVQRNIARISTEIYGAISQRLEIIEEIYKPAADFARNDKLAGEAGITFNADVRFSEVWEKISDSLDGRRNSELFSKLEESRQLVDPNNGDNILELTKNILDRLLNEAGSEDKPRRAITSAFKSKVSAVQLIADVAGLSWLETSFSLSGRGIPLSQLSPGERGLILLLFYLVLDRSDAPLLLDQPEENLDNSAVRRVLVPALQQARKRRQVVVVTHNANLAVVGDADQIIHCSYANDAFSLASGPLASNTTGEVVINILEGARPAFENRRRKYEEVIF